MAQPAGAGVAGPAAMVVEPTEDAAAAKDAAAALKPRVDFALCGRIPNANSYQPLNKCYEAAPEVKDGSNQRKLTLQSITKFNMSDTHHDYGNLAGIEEIKYFAPDPKLVTPGSMSEEATYQYASKMVGVDTDNSAYTCTPILMAYGMDKDNGECLYQALIANGITDPVFIVDVIKSTVFGAMSNPPLGSVTDDKIYPVFLQTTSTLCDPGPKRTRPATGDDLFPGGGARLKWGYSPGNMMYPDWQTLQKGYIERDLMARDTGPEIPYALGINTKAFQILLNPGDAPQNHKAAVVIIDPRSLGSQKRKIYYLEKDHTTKKVKAFRDSAFLNAIKNSFKPVKVVVESAINGGPGKTAGPVILNDLSLPANVLGKRMGDGCQCLQSSMNNLSWFRLIGGEVLPFSGGTAGLVTYDKNCAAYALEVGAPFVIYESHAAKGDDAPVWCNLLTRNSYKNPMAQLESTVKYAEKVRREYTEIIKSIPPKEDIVDIAGFLIGFPGSLGESNSSIQKNFIDYLTSLNNAIPKIVNQNNFNNAFIDASAAFVDADLVQDFNKLTEDANQLIGTLKGKEALSDAEQEQIKELLSQIQSSTPSILSYNEKAKTAIELYQLLKNTGVKGDKIISDSIGEIKLADLVKPPARRSRMAACKSMLQKFVNKIRRPKTNSFLNDATLLTGAGSVIGPLYRILVNVDPGYANTLMEYANEIYDHFVRKAEEQGQPDLKQVFQNAKLQLEAISSPVPVAAAGAAAARFGGGRGAAVAPQMYGGSGEDIAELITTALKGENVAEKMKKSLIEVDAGTFIKSVELLVNSLISQQILNNIIITVNGILTAYEYSRLLSASQNPDRLIDPEVASNPGSVQGYLDDIAKNYLVELGYSNEVDYKPADTDIVIYDNEVVAIQSRVSNPFGLYNSLEAYSDAVDEVNHEGFPQSHIPHPLSLFEPNLELFKMLLAKITPLGKLADSFSTSLDHINDIIERGGSILIKGLINKNKLIEDEIRTTIANTVKDIVTDLTKFLNSQSSEFDTLEFSNFFCKGTYFKTVYEPLEVKIEGLWGIIKYNNDMIPLVEEMYTEPSDAQSSQESGYGSETSEENKPYSIELKMLGNVYNKICKDSKVARIGTLERQMEELKEEKAVLPFTLSQNEEELFKSRSELDKKNIELQANYQDLDELNYQIGKTEVSDPAAAAEAGPADDNSDSKKRGYDEVDSDVERTRSAKRPDIGKTPKINAIESKNKQLIDEISQLNEKISELDRENKKLRARIQELNDQIIPALNKQIGTLKYAALETINKMIDNLNNRFFPPKMDKLGGGKRRTMKSKSKRNAKNQTHRKRKGKAVCKRTATAHRPKTARNAKKITKKSTSNTKTKRSAKPAKKRAINRRARNARKDRK